MLEDTLSCEPDDARDGLLDEQRRLPHFCFSLSCLLRLAPYSPPCGGQETRLNVKKKK